MISGKIDSDANLVNRLCGSSLDAVNLAARMIWTGGAIALGHPLGASGAGILTILIHDMKRRKTEFGLVPTGSGSCGPRCASESGREFRQLSD